MLRYVACVCVFAAQLLGRADNVKDYIRRGADRGWVETTLSGGPGHADIVIRCEMSKTEQGYSTAWKINRECQGTTAQMWSLKCGLCLEMVCCSMYKCLGISRTQEGGLSVRNVWSFCVCS